jgi:hypothetical protein
MVWVLNIGLVFSDYEAVTMCFSPKITMVMIAPDIWGSERQEAFAHEYKHVEQYKKYGCSTISKMTDAQRFQLELEAIHAEVAVNEEGTM